MKYDIKTLKEWGDTAQKKNKKELMELGVEEKNIQHIKVLLDKGLLHRLKLYTENVMKNDKLMVGIQDDIKHLDKLGLKLPEEKSDDNG